MQYHCHCKVKLTRVLLTILPIIIVNPSGVVDWGIVIEPRGGTRATGSRHLRCQADMYPSLGSGLLEADPPVQGRYVFITRVCQIFSPHRDQSDIHPSLGLFRYVSITGVRHICVKCLFMNTISILKMHPEPTNYNDVPGNWNCFLKC